MENKLLIVIFILEILAGDPLYHTSPLKKGEAISVVIFCIAFLT
ncbi:MAG: hypothetical protein AAFR87_04235 [Bacteroidota bacterium]